MGLAAAIIEARAGRLQHRMKHVIQYFVKVNNTTQKTRHLLVTLTSVKHAQYYRIFSAQGISLQSKHLKPHSLWVSKSSFCNNYKARRFIDNEMKDVCAKATPHSNIHLMHTINHKTRLHKTKVCATQFWNWEGQQQRRHGHYSAHPVRGPVFLGHNVCDTCKILH